MGTEFLYPQDLLRERIRGPSSDFSRRKSYNNYSSSPNQKSCRREPQRKRSPQPSQPETFISKRSTAQDDSKPIVMGQVTILKRGESLDSKRKPEKLKKTFSADFIVSGTDRLGPDPGLVPKEIRIVGSDQPKIRTDIYAGSACYLSPSPRSLPLPSFSVKKNVEDSATKDLRRLLRLD